MSYSVQIADEARRRIRELDLPPRIIAELGRQIMADLAEGGPEASRRVVAPLNAYLFTAIVDDPDVALQRHIFLFEVQ